MATRRSMKTSAESLENMVSRYADMKKEFDPLKKQTDELSKKIKAEMRNQDLSEIVVGDVKASISVTPKSDFNELQAIEILRKALTSEQFNACVKTREYIDDDAFENLVYNHQVDASILSPAETPKEPTITLRLSKVKN